MAKINDAPCKDCPDRVLGCQGKCPKYMAYSNRCKANYGPRKEYNSLNSYFSHAINRSIKLRGDRP